MLVGISLYCRPVEVVVTELRCALQIEVAVEVDVADRAGERAGQRVVRRADPASVGPRVARLQGREPVGGRRSVHRPAGGRAALRRVQPHLGEHPAVPHARAGAERGARQRRPRLPRGLLRELRARRAAERLQRAALRHVQHAVAASGGGGGRVAVGARQSDRAAGGGAAEAGGM